MTRARYLADFKQDDGTGYATKYATGFSPQFSGTPTGIVTDSIADGTITAVKVAADVATQAELDTVSTVAGDALPKAGGTMTGSLSITSHPTHGTHHQKRFRSVYPGNASVNYNILRYSRYWWGSGCVKITVMETYYGPSTGHGEFLINGHTRSGLPSIHTLHNYNVPTPTAASWNSAEWCYINLSVGNYRRYDIIVESWHIGHNATESAVAASNSYHFYNSAEIM